jgi:hypothetical protein
LNKFRSIVDRALRNSASDRIPDRILDRDIYSAGSTLCNSSPIDYDAAIARGTIESTEDRVSLLQGDIISTDAAYLLRDRSTGLKFVVSWRNTTRSRYLFDRFNSMYKIDIASQSSGSENVCLLAFAHPTCS